MSFKSAGIMSGIGAGLGKIGTALALRRQKQNESSKLTLETLKKQSNDLLQLGIKTNDFKMIAKSLSDINKINQFSMRGVKGASALSDRNLQTSMEGYQNLIQEEQRKKEKPLWEKLEKTEQFYSDEKISKRAADAVKYDPDVMRAEAESKVEKGAWTAKSAGKRVMEIEKHVLNMAPIEATADSPQVKQAIADQIKQEGIPEEHIPSRFKDTIKEIKNQKDLNKKIQSILTDKKAKDSDKAAWLRILMQQNPAFSTTIKKYLDDYYGGKK